MVVAEVSCKRIPDAVPYEVAALIGCGVATGVGASVHRGQLSEGDTVVVVGAGGVGLSAVMGANMAGAKRIIAVDRAASKKNLSINLGATHFVTADDRAIDEVLNLTEGRGADVVIEAIGNTALQESWLRAVRPGGTMVLVGVPSTSIRQFHPADLIRSEKDNQRQLLRSYDTGQAIDDLCAAYLQGRLPIDRLISKRVAIQDIQLAIDAMLTGAEGRTVIAFD